MGTVFYTNLLQGFEARQKLTLNLREFQVSVRDLLKMLVLKKSE